MKKYFKSLKNNQLNIMNKVNVLVLNSDTDGVGAWRMLMPHLCINDTSINIDIRLIMDGSLPLMDVNFLKQYQVIVYNKMLPINPQYIDMFYNTLKQLGIKLVFDIDDYWILNNTHLNYTQWKNSKSDLQVIDSIKRSDYVTTTTPIFADKIKELNPNVIVLENAVNLKEQQWQSNKPKSDKIRFIWGGGISHMPDLALLRDEFKKFDKEFLEKTQFFMCGFDLRIRLPDGKIMKDDIRRSAWGKFEEIFTNNYKYVSGEYLKFLNIAEAGENYGYNEEFSNLWYQRRWTKEILLYGNMYNDVDVSLAPLKGEGHQFNYHKSQLKLIEAGAHHCPLIASNYGPYTIDDIDGSKGGKQKGFLIDESQNDWYDKMKWYSENPNAVIDHGENNYEYIKANFEMNVVNRKRCDLYKHLAK
jgi:glycosyltransferase involved in cell wall biosynthesis